MHGVSNSYSSYHESKLSLIQKVALTSSNAILQAIPGSSYKLQCLITPIIWRAYIFTIGATSVAIYAISRCNERINQSYNLSRIIQFIINQEGIEIDQTVELQEMISKLNSMVGETQDALRFIAGGGLFCGILLVSFILIRSCLLTAFLFWF